MTQPNSKLATSISEFFNKDSRGIGNSEDKKSSFINEFSKTEEYSTLNIGKEYSKEIYNNLIKDGLSIKSINYQQFLYIIRKQCNKAIIFKYFKLG